METVSLKHLNITLNLPPLCTDIRWINFKSSESCFVEFYHNVGEVKQLIISWRCLITLQVPTSQLTNWRKVPQIDVYVPQLLFKEEIKHCVNIWRKDHVLFAVNRLISAVSTGFFRPQGSTWRPDEAARYEASQRQTSHHTLTVVLVSISFICP